MKGKGQIYKTFASKFYFMFQDLVMIFQSLVMILPRSFDFDKP